MEKYICGGFETNTYLITKNNECIIVDPGLEFYYHKEEVLSKYKVVAILLTHGHKDHIDSIGDFDCPIYIHKEEYKFLTDILYSRYENKNHIRFNFEKLNLIQIEEGHLKISNFDIEVIYTPGHTIGGVCYLYNDKLFTGDTVFCGTVGRTDLPSGNFETLEKSLLKLIKLFKNKDIKIYPGHEESSNFKKEMLNNYYFQSVCNNYKI
ncbi:MAG: MBL fold metallo-hydrolase [Anaeroplasmataceae bacterium]